MPPAPKVQVLEIAAFTTWTTVPGRAEFAHRCDDPAPSGTGTEAATSCYNWELKPHLIASFNIAHEVHLCFSRFRGGSLRPERRTLPRDRPRGWSSGSPPSRPRIRTPATPSSAAPAGWLSPPTRCLWPTRTASAPSPRIIASCCIKNASSMLPRPTAELSIRPQVPGLRRPGHGRAGTARFHHHDREHPRQSAAPCACPPPWPPTASSVVVADTNHNRVLIWNRIPTINNQPADVVVGQPDFTSFGCRATRRTPSPCADRRASGFRTASSMWPTRRTTAC